MYGEPVPRLEHTTQVTAAGDGLWSMSETPVPHRLSADGRGLPVAMVLDAGAGEDVVAAVCRRLASTAVVARQTDFGALLPARIWQESSATGLRAAVGRDGRASYEIVLDDATPHMLLAGRSGAGKTNLLLVLLYALVSRYSPDELGCPLHGVRGRVPLVSFP